MLEAALELYGGKAVLNSINFEDGEAPATARMTLARKFGAAVIALTIDEAGMAKTREDKLRDHPPPGRVRLRPLRPAAVRPADRPADLHDLHRQRGRPQAGACGRWRRSRTSAREFPELQLILGLSNVSFGLNPAARHVLNSVMLDHAMRRGLTGAIVHSSKIMPLHKIPPEEVKAAEDLIFDRRARATTRCRRSWRCSPTARPTPAPPRCGPRPSRSG